MYFSLHGSLSTSAVFSHKKDSNSDFPSLVIHLIAILQRLLVNASNFLIKRLEAFLFSSKFAISIEIKGVLSSKRLGGIIN